MVSLAPTILRLISFDRILPSLVEFHSESSIVSSSRRVGEKNGEASVTIVQKTSPAFDSRSAGHGERGARIVREKVRTWICFARELHGVTIW